MSRKRFWLRTSWLLERTVCWAARRANFRRSHWPAVWAYYRAIGDRKGSLRSLISGGERP